jgi:hypothetical protein
VRFGLHHESFFIDGRLTRSHDPEKASIALVLATSPTLVDATNGHRQPPDLRPTRATLDDARALYVRGTASKGNVDASRVERFIMTAGGTRVEAVATIAGRRSHRRHDRLALFDLWFDYDNGMLYAKRR